MRRLRELHVDLDLEADVIRVRLGEALAPCTGRGSASGAWFLFASPCIERPGQAWRDGIDTELRRLSGLRS